MGCHDRRERKRHRAEDFLLFWQRNGSGQRRRFERGNRLTGSDGLLFYLCELFEKKAKEWGFSDEEAAKMACATFTGAAGLLENSELSAAEWRANVTSKAERLKRQ